MREEIKKKFTPKDHLINQIVEKEWGMFDQVQNQGGRASCQDDEWTFYINRYSQHNALTEDTLRRYQQDLQQAEQDGRNLLTEKYAYMMEFTDPDYFDRSLRKHLPKITSEKSEMVDRIANLMIGCQQQFEKQYPAFSRAGRPLMGTGGSDVSFHIYTIGELKTYSEQTLQLMYKDWHRLCERNENPSLLIHQMTAEFYGYKNLDEAESKLKQRG